AVGDPEIVGTSEINLAANHLALGDVERALGCLEPITQALARGDDPFMRWRYSLHATHVEGLVALRGGAPERALACAQGEAEGTRRHRAPKLEARALTLAGEALLAMDRRAEAGASLGEALRRAETRGYARATRETLGRLAESAGRSGRREDADRHDARRRSLLAAAMRSLSDTELQRQLEAAAGGGAT